MLFLAGHGRSGSTLIGRVLDAQPDFFLAGELTILWSGVMRMNRLCGCGQPFLDCPFWTEVGERAYGGWSSTDAGRVRHLKHAVQRTHSCLPLASPVKTRAFRALLEEYLEVLKPLYRTIAQTSGARVIVDSSKMPQVGLMLQQMDTVSTRVVHLVRSPYGVVHSWGTTKARRDAAPGEGLPAVEPRLAASQWQTYNVLSAALRHRAEKGILVRWEDFVADPVGQTLRMTRLVGIDQLEPGTVSAESVRVGPSHSIAGNPNRFDTGEITVRLDERWKTQMKPGVRRQVSVLTAPTRWVYGYRGSSVSAGAASRA